MPGFARITWATTLSPVAARIPRSRYWKKGRRPSSRNGLVAAWLTENRILWSMGSGRSGHLDLAAPARHPAEPWRDVGRSASRNDDRGGGLPPVLFHLADGALHGFLGGG